MLFSKIAKAFSNPNNFLKNVSWNVCANISSKLIGPLMGILVARILVPEDYGVFAVATAIYALAYIVKDCGVSSAIISISEEYDNTRVHFTIQFFISLICYLTLWLMGPLLSDYFNQEKLAVILLIMGLNLFVTSVEDPLITRHQKNNEYKTLFIRQMIPAIVGGSTALVLAYIGLGVYSLAVAPLAGSFFSAIFLLYTNKWLPLFEFNAKQKKKLINHGKHVMSQGVSGFIAQQLDSLILSKNLGLQPTGIYKMSMNLSLLLPNAVLMQYQQVLFTYSAKEKNNHAYLSHRYNQFINVSFALNTVYFICAYFLTPVVVPLVLGAKWIDIIEPVQLISLSVVSAYLVNPNGQFSQIMGFNHVYSYYSIIRSLVTAICVFVGSMYSLKIAIVTWVGVALISNFINFCLFKNYQNKIVISKSIYLKFIFVWILYVFITYSWLI